MNTQKGNEIQEFLICPKRASLLGNGQQSSRPKPWAPSEPNFPWDQGFLLSGGQTQLLMTLPGSSWHSHMPRQSWCWLQVAECLSSTLDADIQPVPHAWTIRRSRSRYAVVSRKSHVEKLDPAPQPAPLWGDERTGKCMLILPDPQLWKSPQKLILNPLHVTLQYLSYHSSPLSAEKNWEVSYENLDGQRDLKQPTPPKWQQTANAEKQWPSVSWI